MRSNLPDNAHNQEDCFARAPNDRGVEFPYAIALFGSHWTLDETTGNPYIMIGFEWDDDKAARNLLVHRVSFEQAAIACRDPFAVDEIDTREDYGEKRSVLLGLYGSAVLCVAYTERDDNIRIISARRAEKHEQDRYYRENAS